MKRVLIIFSILFLQIAVILPVSAQKQMSKSEYINRYKNVAIDQMQQYKIPASITLAQGILESGSGGSRLAVKANNHFGIKCGGDWKGDKIYHDDDKKGECFRKYKSAYESYVDHSIFLSSRSRYAHLFKLKPDDYVGWAHGLKSAGYATNPKYAQLLINIIEEHNLDRFDLGLLGEQESIFVSIDKHGRWKGENNGVKFVIARSGDTFAGIAYEEKINLRKLLKYNDLEIIIPLTDGVAVYLEQKKRKSSEVKNHTVEFGETVHSISQRFGIGVKDLLRMNKKLKKRNPNQGEVVKLH